MGIITFFNSCYDFIKSNVVVWIESEDFFKGKSVYQEGHNDEFQMTVLLTKIKL